MWERFDFTPLEPKCVSKRFEVQLEVEQCPGQTSREKGLSEHSFRPYHQRRERGGTELANVETCLLMLL